MANRTVSVRLQAEIGQYVSSMSKASAVTMRLGDDATTSSRKAQGGFDLAGKGALLMGGAVAAGIGMAVNASMKFETAMSAVQAATKASAATMNDLREAAMEAGADTQYSATEAADAITEMAKAGVSAKDIMGGGLKGALALAAAGQMEVADAAGIASVAMTQFNLSGADLPHVADLLAAGAGKAMGSVDDLGQALNQSGLIASAAGLSIEETTGTLAAFANAGLIGSDAGTSFKTMLQAIQAPSGKSAELMAELGISMYDANGNMLGAAEMAGVLQSSLGGLTEEQRNAALAQIFGTDAVRAANVLYREGASGIEDWTAKVNDQGFAAETAAALNDNLKGDLERLGGAFETLMIQMGSGAQGPLRELVQALTGLVDVGADLLSFWGDLPGFVQIGVVGMGAWLALRGPLTSMAETVYLKTLLMRDGFDGASGAANKAKDALGGMAKAAAGMAAIWAVTELASQLSDMASTGDDARDVIQGLRGSLDGLAGTEAIDANAAAIKTARDEAAQYQQIIDNFENQNWFNEKIWTNPFSTEELTSVIDADKALELLNEEIRNLEDRSARAGAVTDTLSQKLNLSTDEVQELASKYGVDLSEGLIISQEAFMRMYEAEYGTAPIDAANALTGAVVSAKEQTEEAIKAQEDWLKSLQEIATEFIAPIDAYKGLLDGKMAKERESAEATAAATDDATDSWQDYATDVTVSLDELADKLEEQLLAHDEWSKNIGLITQRGGEDVGRILAGMGEEGVQIAAQMANGTDAEFNRMADLLKRGAQRAGMDSVAEFDYYMKMMALVGASGGKATAEGIAMQLGLGVDAVRDIAARYGVQLAEGINPILGAVGKPTILTNGGGPRTAQSGGGVQGRNNADGNLYENHQAEIAPGGAWRIWAEPETEGEAYIPLAASKRGRSLNIWRETGKRLGAEEAQYFAAGGFTTAASVPRPRSTAPYGFPVSTAGDGTMQTGYDATVNWVNVLNAMRAAQEAAAAAQGATGPIGSGAAGGSWQALWAKVHAAFPTARMTSNYRAGDPGYHGKGKAVDVAGARPGDAAAMMSINRWAAGSMGGSLAQLIYTPGINLLNGKPHTYNAATRADHYDHVHLAAYENGTNYVPRTGLALLHQGEAVIPARMNPAGREFSGAGGGGIGIDYERLARAVGSRSTNIAVTASPDEDRLARKVVDTQRDLEFLHG